MADSRFLENPEDKVYSIERIWDHHESIVNMLVATNGSFTNKQIAKEIGCSAQTVSNVRNNPLIRAKITALQGRANDEAVDVGKKIKEMFPLAAQILENTMKLVETEEDMAMADPRIISQSVRAAVTVLDHAHPKQTQATVMHGHMTMSQIDAIKNKVRERLSLEEAKYEEIPSTKEEEVACSM